MNETILRLRLGITEKSFNKLKMFMPELQKIDSNDEITNFTEKYLSKENFANHTVASEKFVEKFNEKHPECQLELQYCELCSNIQKNVASFMCSKCKKNICNEHCSDFVDLEHADILEFPPVICKECYKK